MTASDVLIVHNVYVATVDGPGTEFASGHLVAQGNRIVAVGAGAPPRRMVGPRHPHRRRVRVCAHARLGQHPSPPLPVDHSRPGPGLDAVPAVDDAVPDLGPHRRRRRARGRGGRPGLDGAVRVHARTDHGYVHPRGGGDVLEAEIVAAQQIGLRFHPTRGSMNLGSRRVACRRTLSWRTTTRSCARPRPRSTAGTTRPATRCSRSGSPRARRSRSPPISCASRPSWPAGAACGCTPIWPKPSTRRSSAWPRSA